MQQSLAEMHARPREFVEKFTWEEFMSLNRDCPHLLFPAFTFHNAVRDKTFGQRFWLRQRQKAVDARTYEMNTANRLREQCYKRQRVVNIGSLREHYERTGSGAISAACWSTNYWCCLIWFKSWPCMQKEPEKRAEAEIHGGGFLPLNDRDMQKLGLVGFRPQRLTPQEQQRLEILQEKDARRARARERRLSS